MKRKQVFALLILCSLVGMTSGAAEREPVQVLILGTYHFRNPGLDLHNVKTDDVRTAAKQAELADVATRLARFNPNKIAVEAVSERQDLTTKKFDAFTPETLTKDADERVQIAFRLARELGHKSVYGIDEQSDKIDYFPYDKVQDYAKTHGQTATLDALNAEVAMTINKMRPTKKRSRFGKCFCSKINQIGLMPIITIFITLCCRWATATRSPAQISTAIGICEMRRSLQSSPRSPSRAIAF
jgi:hypothetical protein